MKTTSLLTSETQSNPKIMLTRALTTLLPAPAIFFLKKHYHAYLFTHMNDAWMEEDAHAIPALVSPGDSVLDIGANIGLYSRFLAHLVGPTGHVYAFEPIPTIFQSLRYNLSKSRLSQVQPFPVALSDSNRDDIMELPNYRWGQTNWYGARFALGDTPRFPRRRIPVSCRTLDSFQLPPISFLKCDAEYHELAVLRGATQTLRLYHPAILVEVFPNPDNPSSTAYQLFALLASLGYQPYFFHHGQMHPRQLGDTPSNPPNYFFLTPHQAANLDRPS